MDVHVPHPHMPHPNMPALRGVSQIVAGIASLLGAIWLVVQANMPLQSVSAAIFGAGLFGSFTASALLHRVSWPQRAANIIRTIDHSMIFAVIACSFVPVCLLVLDRSVGIPLLVIVSLLALGGIVVRATMRQVPRVRLALAYLALGLMGLSTAPELWVRLPAHSFALLATGGALYAIGAIVFILQRPNPSPRWFGFHEVFHLFVFGGAVCIYAGMYDVITAPGLLLELRGR